jgi:hypothetical protein
MYWKIEYYMVVITKNRNMLIKLNQQRIINIIKRKLKVNGIEILIMNSLRNKEINFFILIIRFIDIIYVLLIILYYLYMIFTLISLLNNY